MSLATDLYGPGNTMCCICFEVQPDGWSGWYADAGGGIWNVCAGECASQSDLVEDKENAGEEDV